jgi:hypothetical protein
MNMYMRTLCFIFLTFENVSKMYLKMKEAYASMSQNTLPEKYQYP